MSEHLFTELYPYNLYPGGNRWGNVRVEERRGRSGLLSGLLSRSLPGAVSLVEILRCFSSSSLPPSFTSGRFAAIFFTRRGLQTQPALALV